MRTGGGKPFLDSVARGSAKLLQSGGMKPDAALRTATVAADMACSPLGGHITMIPVKYMEDHSGYLTHTFNKMLDPNYEYKDLHFSANAKDDEYPALADPPNHNSWNQIALRRGLGWIAVTAAGTALNRSGWQDPLQNGTLRVFNKGVDATGSKALRNFADIPRIQRYTKLAALDAYFTVVTSAITEFTKNTVGKSRHGEPEPEEALSVEIPGITEDTNGNGRERRRAVHHKPTAETSHVARVTEKQPKPKQLIPQENYVKSLQSDRDASGTDHSLTV